MKSYSSYILTALIVCTATSFSKVKAPSKIVPKVFLEDTVTPVLPFNNDEYYQKLLGDIKKSPRSSAAATTDVPAIEKTFSTDFLEMRRELIGSGVQGDPKRTGVQTVEELDTVINKYSNPEVYKGLSPQAKFLALQLRALKPMKGFIFRAKLYIAGISATRTMIVSALRAQMAGIQTFFPLNESASVNHWEIVFKYMTENSPGIGSEILTDDDLYVFFRQLTNDYAVIVNDFGDLVKSGQSIWWDNKLYMSFASFASEKDRYVLLGKPELYALYSASAANASVLYSTTAYSFTGLRDAVKKIGQLFGIDNIVETAIASIDGKGAQGMSSHTRIKVLRQYPKLFVRVSDGEKRMQTAYAYLVSAARSARLSFEETKKLKEGDENLFDVRVANAFNRIAGTSFANIDQLIDEKEPISSAIVNGERVRVSLKNFYYNSPASLSELYPTNWNLSSEDRKVSVPGYSAKGQQLRNYKYGMAVEWNLAPYKNMFPDLVGTSNGRTKDLPKYVRILSQTWGSSVFAIPLGAAIF
ncbi:MAG: hypothetical protein JNM24_02105 [Bdellovibrionaceae bacterium]|nr:hypothetical protein [Pseudobdellovibrionaceae bacterium]